MKIPADARVTPARGAEAETRGAFILVIAAALLLIFVGLFMWYKTAMEQNVPAPTPSRPTLETNKEPETVTATAQVESFGAMSTSDELSTIEADLESTYLDGLDSELMQIDAELEASLE